MTLTKGAIRPWRTPDKRMGQYYKLVLEALCEMTGASQEAPFQDLPDEFKQKLFYGSGGKMLELGGNTGKGGRAPQIKAFEGLVPMVERQMHSSESELKKNRLKAYFARKACTTCAGARLRSEILGVTLESIVESEKREWNIEEFLSLIHI